MNRPVTLTVPAALLALLPLAAAAQDAPSAAPPTAQAVVARFVDAAGGPAALARSAPRYEAGRMEIPAAGITVRFEAWFAAGRSATASTMPGLGVVRAGFDGHVGWIINPASGPALLEGAALRQAEQSADPLAPLHPDRYVAAMEPVTDTVFDGVPCWVVRITTPWDERYVEYFDRASGLLAGSVRTQVTPQGRIEVTTRVVEWRTVAGARLPRVTRSRMLGREFVSTVDSTAVGALPDSLFALPPEIRALRSGGQ